MERRVLVCGGRDYNDERRVFEVLDQEHKAERITLLIHGAAKGADSLARKWAWDRGVRVRGYPAEWQRYGRRAGPIRNTEMLADAKPHYVVAFPGNEGTRDMTTKARKAVVVVRYISR